MILRLSELKEGKNFLEESLTPEELQLDKRIYRDPVTVSGTVDFNEHLLVLRLHVKTRGLFTCDRCALEFYRDFNPAVNLHILRREPRDRDEEETEGLAFMSVRATEVDLRSYIAEEILLDVPMQMLCREECKGLCFRCGADLNEGPCGCDNK